MKALTVWQPWASLILIGAKPYEFRSWKPPAALIGQRIAIHAGARKVRMAEIHDLAGRFLRPGADNPCLIRTIAEPYLNGVLVGQEKPPLAHVLCTAILGAPKRGDECAAEFGGAAGNDSDRGGTFNFGWPLTAIEPLIPPLPARGAQGLWTWSET